MIFAPPRSLLCMPDVQILTGGLAFPESPRWHEGRVWVSDWGADEVIALDLEGRREVVARVASFPMCIDFLPDGRLLIVSAADGRLLRHGARRLAGDPRRPVGPG